VPINGELTQAVATVAESWKESQYYEHAEQWTFAFWNEGTVFRRMFDQLNIDRLLELACGHGRHAERVVSRTTRLVLMDIHDENIAVCQQRLGHHAHVSVLKNNGFDFQPLPDADLTGIFCYDAMVHFDHRVVASYLKDTFRVLRPGGKALYHHSNYAAPLDQHYGMNPHARNHMTQQLFASLTTEAGLKVIDSQVIDWGADANLDCVTLIRRPD
jgi:ubiquinone/menaquinone biosynthesis C-methylase UbiE